MSGSPSIIDMAAFSRVPVAPDRFVGWVRACIAVGRSLYGDAWDVSETARTAYTQADRTADISARVAEQFPAPQFTKAPAPATKLNMPPAKPVDPEVLERIKAGAQKIREQKETLALRLAEELPSVSDMAAANIQRKGMLANAQAALFDAVLNGRVAAFWWRDGSNSLPAAMTAAQVMSAWNSATGRENLSRRGYVWADRAARYVYVDAGQLAAAFPSAPPIEVPTGFNEEDLSDYMRLALHVASQGYGAQFTGLKKEIRRKLVEHAPQFNLGDGLLTETMEEALATILRNLDAQAGKGGRLRGKNTN